MNPPSFQFSFGVLIGFAICIAAVSCTERAGRQRAIEIYHAIETYHDIPVLPEVHAGDVWQYTYGANDPFAKPEIRTYRVLDVKLGTDGRKYIKSVWIEENMERSSELSWFIAGAKKISP